MVKHTITLPNLPSLYQLKEDDYDKGVRVLAEAFKEDPIWSRILENELEKFYDVYAVPVKYTLYYGKAYAISKGIEGLLLLLSPPYTNMNVFRMIRSKSLRLGLKIGGITSKKITQVFRIIEKDRRELMKEPYVYVFALGIHPNYQGQGHGTKLMNTLLDGLPPEVPVYLETESEQNVGFYEKLGFDVLKKITVPVLKLPMWEMISRRNKK
jgi:ribosomal protein S18 acetylase RimI-like enzyme